MQARLSAVQHALVAVTVAALGVAVLVRPAPENADYRRALTELTSIERRFDRSRVEAQLRELAAAEGRQPLGAIVKEVNTLRGLELRLAEPDMTVDPWVRVELASLSDLASFAEPDASLPAAVADLSHLSRALAWRLTYAQPAPPEPLILRRAQLQTADVSAADVARELEVFQLQTAAREATAALAETAARLETIEHLYEARVKRHVSRKLRAETYLARQEARRALREARRALNAAEQRYRRAAQTALQTPDQPASSGQAARGVIQVELQGAAGRTSYAIPVDITARALHRPRLRGVSLRETRAAGLWPELAALDVASARARVQRKFNWHYRRVAVAGIRLPGMTLLQVVPCVLPLMLGLLLARMRAVLLAYNPFRTRVRSALRRVGYHSRALDALAVIVLPLTAAGLAASALVLVGQMPVLPLAAAVASLWLGSYAFAKLGQLQRLAEDVARSHSWLPPPNV